MNNVRKKDLLRVAIDSNVFISALVYGGHPAACIALIYERQVLGVISDAIITEVLEVLARKFIFSAYQLEEVRQLIETNFVKVYPAKTLNITRDPDDNRILETAVAGECDYIITGDLDLLDLKEYSSIHILTPAQFLNLPS